jgi:hypothetical protein
MEYGLMEDKIDRDSITYAEGYQEGWENAINYVLDISQQMRYNNPYIGPTLEELEQRIV